MFGNRPIEIHTEKMAREDARERLKFPGVIIALSLIAAGYFVWQDGGFSSNVIIALLFAAFWSVPFVLVLLEFRRIKREYK